MKNILYLSYDGITDPLGQSQVLPYVIGLARNKNYCFTIISFEKAERYLENRKSIQNIVCEHNISWTPLSYTKRPPVFSTIWDIYKLNKVINNLLKNRSIDLIHCRSYITSIVAIKTKRNHNIPFIFDMRGFYADERVDGGIWNKEHFLFKRIYNFFKKKEREFLQQSSYTVSLTNTGKKEILSWNLANQSKIKVIPCCTDENLFKEENVINIKTKLNIKDEDFVISYVGSIGTWYMIDEMLDFFKLLLTKNKNAKFLFITKDNPDEILNCAKEKGINKDNIIITPSERKMMPSYIGLSNFSIFFILPVFSKKASSPTKMGEIMNLGIPIICNSGVGDVDEIMSYCMPELLINDFSSKEYNRVIELILNNYKANKQEIINTSHKYYSLEKGVEKYKEIYKEILKA